MEAPGLEAVYLACAKAIVQTPEFENVYLKPQYIANVRRAALANRAVAELKKLVVCEYCEEAKGDILCPAGHRRCLDCERLGGCQLCK